MAQGKKSFIAYSDWKDIFNELPDEDAGKLIKHIFSYVNDENPKSDSVLIRAVFAQIKSTLKRDLDKWDKQLEQRKEAGIKSGLSRRTKTNDRSDSLNEHERKRTVNDSVNVNVSVNDILLEKETKYTFDDFWNKYPNKVAKKSCESKFSKLSNKEKELIKNTIDSFIENKPFKDYTHPHPLTYLNQKRWDDEINNITSKTFRCEYINANGKVYLNHNQLQINEFTKSGYSRLVSKQEI